MASHSFCHVINFYTSLIEFLAFLLAHTRRLLATNPAFCRIRKLQAMSSSEAFKSFRREANALSENTAKKISND